MFSCQIKYKLSKKTLVEKLAQRKLQESKGPVHLLHVPLPNNISEARDNYANCNNIKIKNMKLNTFFCFASNYLISKK